MLRAGGWHCNFLWRKPIRQPALLRATPCCHCQRQYQVGWGNSDVLIPGHQQLQGQDLERIQVTQCLHCWWSFEVFPERLWTEIIMRITSIWGQPAGSIPWVLPEGTPHFLWWQRSFCHLNSGYLLVSTYSVPRTVLSTFHKLFQWFHNNPFVFYPISQMRQLRFK